VQLNEPEIVHKVANVRSLGTFLIVLEDAKDGMGSDVIKTNKLFWLDFGKDGMP
jgi:hypothetical protein